MAVEDAKEEKQELAEAWPMLLPAPTDLVVQYCVKDCDVKESAKCLKMRSDPDAAIAEGEYFKRRRASASRIWKKHL